MGHFAHLENDVVTQVIVIDNNVLGEPTLSFPDTENAGRAFIANVLRLPGEWRQTSYNGNFRGFYASEGYFYDRENDVFVAPVVEEIDVPVVE